nr:FtsW/RodA/SpoVE family cell cycle protein [Bacteroidales bacterium]
WINIPFVGLTLQSSDPAKLVLITFLAFQLTKFKDDLGNWTGGFAWTMGPVILITVLILPANFSTAALIFVLCIIMMFVGNTPLKNLVTVLVAGLIGVIILLTASESLNKAYPENKLFKRTSTWVSRIKVFTGMVDDKTKLQDLSYQLDQSQIAIANGKITGVGPGNSKQRNFLPHPYSDFIYAIIVEEYGLPGSFLIIALYLILFYRGIVIASKVKSRFGALLAFGLSLAIIIQATINVFVAQGLFPVTGQPLPLVSMGGTSMWFTCLGLGMLQSVCRNSQETEAEQDIYGREVDSDEEEYEYVDEDELEEEEKEKTEEDDKTVNPKG